MILLGVHGHCACARYAHDGPSNHSLFAINALGVTGREITSLGLIFPAMWYHDSGGMISCMAAVRFAMNVCHLCGEDRIQAKVTSESEHAITCFISFLSLISFDTVFINNTNKFAAHNYKQASDTLFSGASLDLAHTKVSVLALAPNMPDLA